MVDTESVFCWLIVFQEWEGSSGVVGSVSFWRKWDVSNLFFEMIMENLIGWCNLRGGVEGKKVKLWSST